MLIQGKALPVRQGATQVGSSIEQEVDFAV